jgi:hypothetical protein
LIVIAVISSRFVPQPCNSTGTSSARVAMACVTRTGCGGVRLRSPIVSEPEARVAADAGEDGGSEERDGVLLLERWGPGER